MRVAHADVVPSTSPQPDRPVALAASDPLAILLSGGVAVLAAAGVFGRLGMNADGIAQLLGGLMMVAAAVRWHLERRGAVVRALSHEAEIDRAKRRVVVVTRDPDAADTTTLGEVEP